MRRLRRATRPQEERRLTPEQGEIPTLCPKLPLLDSLKKQIGGLSKSTCGLVGLQHLFGSTASLFHALAENRLQASGVFLLGKPYSANSRVMNHLRKDMGFYVHPQSGCQPVAVAGHIVMKRRIEEVFSVCRRWFRGQPRHSSERIVLIDDGGQAIRLLHAPQFADLQDHFTCVEQTRSGIRALRDLSLHVPVVNVAESWVKLEHESPLIAESVKAELLDQLAIIASRGIRVGRNALVLGFGAIGRAVAGELHKSGFRVVVFDPAEASITQAKQGGYSTHQRLPVALGHADLVVGCTGTPSLDCPDYTHIKDGAVLVSASSSDVEFKAWHLRASGIPLGIPRYWKTNGLLPENRTRAANLGPLPSNHPCFSLYRVGDRGRAFYLVNGGFPVNFNGGVDPIPPEMIQITRGLLYAGAVQASRESRPGLRPLEEVAQKLVFATYRSCLGLPESGAAA